MEINYRGINFYLGEFFSDANFVIPHEKINRYLTNGFKI